MSGALDGLRVVDFGQYIAGPLVAQLLADNGAEVIRVERPDGPAWSSEANAILQRGKHCIVLNLKDPADLAVARDLVARADVVIENFRPGVMQRLGLGYSTVCEANSRLIYCSIPGFASSDPRAGMYAHEGVVSVAAGLYVQRDFDPMATPTVNSLPIASVFATLVALNCLTAALIARERSGKGQQVEVSMFDAAFEVIRFYGDQVKDYEPERDQRNDAYIPETFQLGGSHDPPTADHYLCSDGKWVHLSWLEGRQLVTFAEIIGKREEWQAAGIFDIPFARFWFDDRLRAEVRRRLADAFVQRTAAEWERLVNPECDLTECQTTQQWLLYDEQARAIDAVITLTDPHLGVTHQLGHPVTLSKTPARAQFPRQPPDEGRRQVLDALANDPAPTAHTSLKGELRSALQGIRAIDMCQLLAGPTACRILHEYGAEIVQIANPNGRASLVYHRETNGGKRSITIDLKMPGGLDVLWRLIDGADVVSTNFSESVAARLGVDEASVRRHNPEIVYSRLSAHGNVGPRAEYRGHEQVGQTVTGMEVRFGRDREHPIMQPFALNDCGCGHLTAWAMLLGLYHRLRTGEGQWVGSSLAQSATLFQLPYMVAHRSRDWEDPGGIGFTGFGLTERLYRGSDGWFFLGAPDSEASRKKLVSCVGTLDFSGNVDSQLTDIFAELPVETWTGKLTDAGLGAHKWNTISAAMNDPWARDNGISVDVVFPDGGPGLLVGPAPRLSDTPMRMGTPAMPIGAHTAEILGELGYSHADIEELEKAGTIRLSPKVVEPEPTPT